MRGGRASQLAKAARAAHATTEVPVPRDALDRLIKIADAAGDVMRHTSDDQSGGVYIIPGAGKRYAAQMRRLRLLFQID